MKTTKKQTAVEWLLNEISLTTILDKEDVKLFQQAKEMEKQQIIDADLNGSVRTAKSIDYRITQLKIKELAEQYYNETYEI